MYINKESLTGNSKSKFILIEDTFEMSGIKLLKTIIKIFYKENINIQCINYELLDENLSIQTDISNKISKLNAVSDPCGWTDKSAPNLRSLDEFLKHVSGFKGLVCIDSLSPLLFHNDLSSVFRALHTALKENPDLQLIAMLHADVHDSSEKEILEMLASTVFIVSPCEGTLLTTVCYSSGKVTNQLVEYKISDGFEFSVLRDINPQVKSVSTKPDPTANLTFNLKLKENEKEARSQLKLPYMQVQNECGIMELDNDMYDEEDPDDDLDI